MSSSKPEISMSNANVTPPFIFSITFRHGTYTLRCIKSFLSTESYSEELLQIPLNYEQEIVRFVIILRRTVSSPWEADIRWATQEIPPSFQKPDGSLPRTQEITTTSYPIHIISLIIVITFHSLLAQPLMNSSNYLL
jgi:hypothetical protein